MAQHAKKEFKATQEAGVVKMRRPVHFPSINAIPQTIAIMCMTGTTFLAMWPMVRMGAVALAFDQMNGLICIRAIERSDLYIMVTFRPSTAC